MKALEGIDTGADGTQDKEHVVGLVKSLVMSGDKAPEETKSEPKPQPGTKDFEELVSKKAAENYQKEKGKYIKPETMT